MNNGCACYNNPNPITLSHDFLETPFYLLERCRSILCTMLWHYRSEKGKNMNKHNFLYTKLASVCVGNANTVVKIHENNATS